MSLLHDAPPRRLPAVRRPTRRPRSGATVTVRVRTGAADPVERGLAADDVRRRADLPPLTTSAARDEHTVWWEGALPVHNPVTHYRFLLARRRRTASGWLTGVGVRRPRPAGRLRLPAQLATPPAPDWARDGVVYQVFPDRFARSAAADERDDPGLGGAGGVGRRGRLRGLRPAHAAAVLRRRPRRHHRAPRPPRRRSASTSSTRRRSSRARATTATTPSTFDEVDPLLGGDAALRPAGDRRPRPRLADPRRPHHQPHGRHPRVVRRARRRRGRADAVVLLLPPTTARYECWMGHGTLPKLNHADPDAARARWSTGPDSVVGALAAAAVRRSTAGASTSPT